MIILVAYDEIALKSRYVRNKLERMLVDHIRFKLHHHGYSGFSVSRRFGRIYVEGVPEKAASLIAQVFGVALTMPAREAASDLTSVIQLIVEVAGLSLKEAQTFALRPKVVGDCSFSSQELAIEGGSAVLDSLRDRNITVNLNHPDQTIYIEVRNEKAFAYTKIIQGVRGLPYGSQGKLVALFSGGIDSPVATWLMMKRGADFFPLFINQRPYVGENYIDRAMKAFTVIREYVPRKTFNFYTVDFSRLIKVILESPETRFRCLLCKRSMYRIAENFAKSVGAEGIVTGESIGQVASQTLKNLHVLDSAAETPIFRPIIAFDKIDIERIARRIGTYEVTAKKVEGCKMVPPKPATRSTISRIVELEEELGLTSLCSETMRNIWVESFQRTNKRDLYELF